MKRICNYCGVEFDGGPNALFCPDCRRQRSRERGFLQRALGPYRPLGSIDFCEVCGKEYIVRGGRQRYCPDCAPKAIYDRSRRKHNVADYSAISDPERRKDVPSQRQLKPYPPRKCVICGEMFTDRSFHAKTCSDECAALLVEKNRQAWAERTRQEQNARHLAKYNERMAGKIAAMTPEEYAAYCDEKRAKDRAYYQKRKKQKKTISIRTALRNHISEVCGGDWEPVTAVQRQNGIPWQISKFEQDVAFKGDTWHCVILAKIVFSLDDSAAVDSSEDILFDAWRTE